MRNVKKIAVLILCAVLIGAFCIGSAFADTTVATSIDEAVEYLKQNLSPENPTVTVTCSKSFPFNAIRFSYEEGIDSHESRMHRINCENEWVDNDGNILYEFTMTTYVTDEQEEAINAKATEIVNSLGLNSYATEVEKFEKIYDWVLVNTAPYTSRTDAGELYDYPETGAVTAYGALFGNETLCAGYADTLCVLCNKAGIECYFAGNQIHAWNQVVIDGVVYSCDMTVDKTSGHTPATKTHYLCGFDNDGYWALNNADPNYKAGHNEMTGAYAMRVVGKAIGNYDKLPQATVSYVYLATHERFNITFVSNLETTKGTKSQQYTYYEGGTDGIAAITFIDTTNQKIVTGWQGAYGTYNKTGHMVGDIFNNEGRNTNIVLTAIWGDNTDAINKIFNSNIALRFKVSLPGYGYFPMENAKTPSEFEQLYPRVLWSHKTYEAVYRHAAGADGWENTTINAFYALCVNNIYKFEYIGIPTTWYSLTTGKTYTDGMTVKDIIISEGVESDADLYFEAIWPGIGEQSGKTYMLYFNTNGGSFGPASIKKMAGIDCLIPTSVPVRTGYKFVGWSVTGATTTEIFQPGGVWSKDCNYYLRAIWDPITYTVTFNSMGGAGAVGSISVVFGEKFTLPTSGFTKSGYDLAGWSISQTAAENGRKSYSLGEKVSDIHIIDKGIKTLYAAWTPKAYSVVLMPNGGVGTMQNIVSKKDGMFTLPAATFTKAGMKFVSWNTASNGKGTTFAPGRYKAGSGNLILYAQWTTNQTYSVLLDYNLPSGTNQTVTKIKEAGKNLTITIPHLFSDYGTFLGWKYNGTVYSAGRNIKITEDRNVVVSAQWDSNLQVKFSANGGTGSMNSYKVSLSRSFTLPSCTFKRDGYTFAGWRSSSGKSYANGGIVTATKAGTITFFAQWTTAKTYTYALNYNYPGGQTGIRQYTKIEGKPLAITFPKPTSYAGTFKYWSGSGKTYTGGTSVNFGIDSNLTFNAVWERARKYTYNFYSLGSLVAGENKYSGDYITLGSLGATGTGSNKWEFDYWVDSNGTTYSAGQMLTVGASDRTFTAVWKQLNQKWIPPVFSDWFNASSRTDETYYKLDQACRRNLKATDVMKTVQDYEWLLGSWFDTSSKCYSDYGNLASERKQGYYRTEYNYTLTRSSYASGYTAHEIWQESGYNHYVDTSHYESQPVKTWDYYEQEYIISGYKDVWVSSGYYQWIDTSGYVVDYYYKNCTEYTYHWQQRNYEYTNVGSHEELDYVRYTWEWRSLKEAGYWQPYYIYKQ